MLTANLQLNVCLVLLLIEFGGFLEHLNQIKLFCLLVPQLLKQKLGFLEQYAERGRHIGQNLLK